MTPAERLHEGAGAQMLADQPAVLERHPVDLGELQVGDLRRGLRRHLPALGEAVLVERGQPEEAVLALGGDRGRRAVGTEEVVDVEFVERDQPRHPARHLGMSGQRAVLGPRQRQARLAIWERQPRCRRPRRRREQNRKRRIHASSANQSS